MFAVTRLILRRHGWGIRTNKCLLKRPWEVDTVLCIVCSRHVSVRFVVWIYNTDCCERVFMRLDVSTLDGFAANGFAWIECPDVLC